MRLKSVSLGLLALFAATVAEARAVSGANVQGQGSARQTVQPERAGKLDRLCQAISLKAKDTTSGTDYSYVYQRTVYDAAGVDYMNDTDEEIAAKVGAMWKRERMSEMRCGPMDVPATGSPLRFAIYTSFDDFITDYLSMWKLDLNEIENGQTMLDFLDERISKSSGVVRQNLERYRRGFVSAGAKRRSEL